MRDDADDQHHKGLRILVVDDNHDAASSMSMLLELEGHQAGTVHDGLEAVIEATRVHYDAVLLDLGMPIMDGFQAAAVLGRLWPAPTMIACSAWDDAETRRRTTDLGFFMHLRKPVCFQELKSALRELLPLTASAADPGGLVQTFPNKGPHSSMTTNIHKNFIAGAWVEGPGVSTNINPSDTQDVVGHFTHGDAGQTEQAIDAAFDAQADWARATAESRSDALDRIGSELLARSEELGRLLSREEGKTLLEGIGEVMRAGRVFKFFAGEALRLSGERLASIRAGVDVEVMREPEGVVGIITPWNFPIAIPAWKIAPALAYGNSVVFKPADLVPGSAWALSEIIVRAGQLPAGVFNLVMGPGSKVGQTLVASSKVRALTFTGSVSTGRRIGITCMERGAKVQLEMGGKNPLIVLDDADLEVAVSVATNGSFFSTGQRCTGSSRLIVQAGIHDRFVAALRERLSTLKVDHALKAGTDIGPVASQEQLDQDRFYIDLARQEGCNVAFGGELLDRETPGFYLAPALITETNNQMRVNREEIFGPVATVLRVTDYEEAVQVANDTIFGLSSGICTTSLKYATDYKRRSTAGMVMVNLPTAGVDYHAPFGGRKGSSHGPREQGAYAREFYTSVKTAYTLA